jgi:hypothetical protein
VIIYCLGIGPMGKVIQTTVAKSFSNSPVWEEKFLYKVPFSKYLPFLVSVTLFSENNNPLYAFTSINRHKHNK